MQQHFQMTEEILALMLERRKVMAAQAPTGSTAASQSRGMQSGGMPGMRMMEHGMGHMPQGQGMMQKEMGGMPGHSAPGVPSGQTAPSNDMEQMMQRIAEHSAYMETIQDRTLLAQEMLRHQKMLDQMLQLMQ
jgi:hypothetical protein